MLCPQSSGVGLDSPGRRHTLADQRKAFDSIKADATINALRVFGFPLSFIEMVQSIYRDRVFRVCEGGAKSSEHFQRSGICQGCPLPHFFHRDDSSHRAKRIFI